jgi:hypothetical protein
VVAGAEAVAEGAGAEEGAAAAHFKIRIRIKEVNLEEPVTISLVAAVVVGAVEGGVAVAEGGDAASEEAEEQEVSHNQSVLYPCLCLCPSDLLSVCPFCF